MRCQVRSRPSHLWRRSTTQPTREFHVSDESRQGRWQRRVVVPVVYRVRPINRTVPIPLQVDTRRPTTRGDIGSLAREPRGGVANAMLRDRAMAALVESTARETKPVLGRWSQRNGGRSQVDDQMNCWLHTTCPNHFALLYRPLAVLASPQNGSLSPAVIPSSRKPTV